MEESNSQLLGCAECVEFPSIDIPTRVHAICIGDLEPPSMATNKVCINARYSKDSYVIVRGIFVRFFFSLSGYDLEIGSLA